MTHFQIAQQKGAAAVAAAPLVDPGRTRAVTCLPCRRSMRIWAHDYRRQSDSERKRACLSAAVSFRDGPCFHPLGAGLPTVAAAAMDTGRMALAVMDEARGARLAGVLVTQADRSTPAERRGTQ
jgi:hypothetical protein